jgi:2-oxoglutarate ferredoxin oxidoreductase subunit alpha
MDRGKVLTAEDLQRLQGVWGRYKDVDGDGICYRTLPGTQHPSAAYFTRGTGHNEYAGYSEQPEDWEANLNRLARKFETARALVPGPVVDTADSGNGAGTMGTRIGIVSVGTNDPAVREARDMLRAAGVQSDYMRLRALPINQVVRDFVHRYDRVFVVENNHGGQLQQILLSEEPNCGGDLVSVARCNGLPLTAQWITDKIRQQL